MKRHILATYACGTLLAVAAVAIAQPAGDSPNAARPVPPPVQPGGPGGLFYNYFQLQDHSRAQLQRQASPADQLDRTASGLIRQWQATEDDVSRSKVEEELRAALEESFEARLKEHERQVQELEERVKQLREQLDRRREKQDEIIDFRLQQLLREAQGLGWGTEPVTSAGVSGLGGKSPRVQVPVNVPDGGTILIEPVPTTQPVRP